MKLYARFIKVVLVVMLFGSAQAQDSFFEPDLIEIIPQGDSVSRYFVSTDELYEDRWDTLAHPNFWKKIMKLTPDSCIINVAATRQVISTYSFKDWQCKTDNEKQIFKDSIRDYNCLASDEGIYITSGKSHFYRFDKSFLSVSKGVEVFSDLGVDPFYAQAILLIESPNQLQYSNVGAYGSFQLMKSVARAHGLTVNKYVDERKDFVKSAKGAASLLSKTCIPEARKILNRNNLTYKETDLWFRLVVLHVYHAGAGNVGGLIDSLEPTEGGMALIQSMWVNSWGGFKNASQNYSQLALASILTLNELIYSECDYMFRCSL